MRFNWALSWLACAPVAQAISWLVTKNLKQFHIGMNWYGLMYESAWSIAPVAQAISWLVTKNLKQSQIGMSWHGLMYESAWLKVDESQQSNAKEIELSGLYLCSYTAQFICNTLA